MITITYTPWTLRGITVPTWQVYVEITDSHDLRSLKLLRHCLNYPPVSGVVLLNNKSKALHRLDNGWKKIDTDLWYKLFDKSSEETYAQLR